MNILDLGCGDGKKARTEGFDTNSDGYLGLDLAPKIKPSKVYDLESGKLPFKNDTFEIVLAFNILEHIYKFIEITKECYRVLRKGGKLYIEVPAEYSLNLWDDYTHKRAFTGSSASKLLTDCGFEIESVKTVRRAHPIARIITIILRRNIDAVSYKVVAVKR